MLVLGYRWLLLCDYRSRTEHNSYLRSHMQWCAYLEDIDRDVCNVSTRNIIRACSCMETSIHIRSGTHGFCGTKL